MVVKVPLFDSNFKIPTWWSGFYEDLRIKYPRGEDRNETNINLELEPYNALWAQGTGTPYVEFDTEQDYVMFVLRWS